MIDKPKGKVGILADSFFKWCKKQVDKLDEKTKCHRDTVKAFKGKHPRVARTIVVTACTLAVGLVIVGFATPKTVTVIIDDSNEITTVEYETTCVRVDSFIENHEIDYVYGQDLIDVELYDSISNGMVINIKKAVHIPVTADGNTETIVTMPVTTKEVLDEMGIVLGENDIVEPELDHVLKKGDEVQVKRVTTDEYVEEVEVPYTTSYINDYSIAIGKTEVVQEGSTGREKNTYSVVYVDGVETSRTLVSSEVVQEKKDEIIAMGTNMNLGTPEGLQYKTKISGVKAVSYYFSGNPVGSYGLPCTYGTCAVDPSVIPLGSLLYVEGYGYAIANDVGSGIKGNMVDLYMEDINQCYQWGARTVNVYIIN